MKALTDWLHQGTTILGIAVIGGAVSAVLLGTATPKQAAAAAIGGLISIAMRQVSGTTIVTGSMPNVTAENVSLTAPAGSRATIVPSATTTPVVDKLG